MLAVSEVKASGQAATRISRTRWQCSMIGATWVAAQSESSRAPVRNAKTGARRLCPGQPSNAAVPLDAKPSFIIRSP